jgi:hypothetical protein
LLRNGADVQVEQRDDKFILCVPEEQRDPFDTVVVLS